jgi:hypothetical protein
MTRSRQAAITRNGLRRSDRTDVGCTHTEACPLFPLLNASLDSWRIHYCDSEDHWRNCARYELAVTGKLVPISLLPNGQDARHLKRARDQSNASPPSRPGAQAESGWGASASARFESAFPPAPSTEPQQAPPLSSRPPWTEPAANTPTPKRRWWTRLADWMKGSA